MKSFTSIFGSLLAATTDTPSELYVSVGRPISIALLIAMGVAAIVAIILVMIQPGNSQGIDALGGSSETFYGKNKGRSTEAKLKLGTYICLGILALFAITFFILQYPGIWA